MSEESGAGEGGTNELAALKYEASQRRVENKRLSEELERIKAEQATREKEDMQKRGDVEGLYKTAAQENESLVKRNAELAAEVKAATEREQAAKARAESELAEIAKNAPEAMREELLDTTTPLETRQRMAKKLDLLKPPPVGYRPPGEPPPETLKAKYEEAIKSGDVMAQISLKNQMAEASKT